MRGIWLWMLERYPPGIILVHALAYMTSIAVVQGLLSDTIVFSYLRDGFGILVFFMFPLILRIMDEHKDYEADCVLHPDRVLQRGDTSLSTLKRLAVVCACIQLGYCLVVDGGIYVVTIMWAITMLYAILMAKEFFLGAWLQKRMMLYAISHQLITPISVVWFCSIATTPDLPPVDILGFALLGLLTTFAYELTRKIRPPEEERVGLDSYTKSLGSWQAPALALCIFVGIGAGTPFWLNHMRIPWDGMTGVILSSGALVGLCVFCSISFIRSPEKKWAKGMEAMSALMTLWMYGWILYTVLQASKVQWIS